MSPRYATEITVDVSDLIEHWFDGTTTGTGITVRHRAPAAESV